LIWISAGAPEKSCFLRRKKQVSLVKLACSINSFILALCFIVRKVFFCFLFFA